MSDTAQLLRLLQLASPALPVGAFHFSQGLEHAVHAQLVRDEATATDWIVGIGTHALATLDLPVLLRMRECCSRDEREGFRRWSRFLIAWRETDELRAEDRHMGAALYKLLPELGCEVLDASVPCYAAAFATACARWRIDAEKMLATYAWAWAENQTLAAVKLVPLGQTSGQRMLLQLTAQIPAWVDCAMRMGDEEIAVATPMLCVASAIHETQYSRLFRS